VASTSNTDARSSFSNYGNAIVWVAAPGEAIVTTYPFSTYSAGWGTSFSAPFVSGGAALLRNLRTDINEPVAAAAVGHAQFVGADMGKGRLDLLMALTALTPGGNSPDFGVSAAPSSATITAGQQANFTVSAAPAGGFNQTVSWSCTGAPTASMCTVSPSSVTLDGKNPATATVTLMTTARSFSPPFALPRMAPPMFPREVLVVLCVLLLLAVMLWNLSRKYRRRPGLATAAGLLAVSLCSYSCGGGYGNGNTPGSASLSAVALNPSSVKGGSSSTGTVTLSGPASSGGAVVYLTSSASAATVPASVTVAAGATSATFTVNTTAVTTSTPATISATYAGATKTASVTVTPVTPAGTFTLTITGTSGTLTHSSTVQITVQ
jgi:hypothetical protein